MNFLRQWFIGDQPEPGIAEPLAVNFEKIEEKLNVKRIRFNTLKHEVETLLNLAMKNAVPQGATFKTKMADAEAEIERLGEEIEKLEEERKAAQLSAHSGEHVYVNVKTVMQYIDEVPPEIQKNLLRALIENITVYDDKIVMDMNIEPKALPGILPEALSQKKNPTPPAVGGKDEVSHGQSESPVASTAQSSNWRPSKGRFLGESQISDVQLVQLVARVYIRKRKNREISIDLPFPT